MESKKITFKKAVKTDKKLIKSWFDKPHVKEYWDNSKEMWDNVESYLEGDKILFDYWICLYDKEPYGLIMTSDAAEPDPRTKKQLDYFIPWIEPEGTTLTIDFMIGEKAFLGKGLSDLTLKKFAEVQEPSVTAFLVDPEVKNEKALHVYEKAGFVRVSTFIRGQGFFKGKPHYLLKMKIQK
ncbi:MAG: GNAT family N-acetyltransferase [Verrucomicrobia bacterium]|nr:GNAT family N-acetyltransferase [Verrucomicrobiota bacterium]